MTEVSPPDALEASLRPVWRERLLAHDGEVGDAKEGGLRRSFALTGAQGPNPAHVVSMRGARAQIFVDDAPFAGALRAGEAIAQGAA